ncbi:hypothetical protein LOTGIDRAFT_163226 [Lottia gigantea]|uniref:Uncharacterized protein n=1 Tax=Lottia gigantea TaxID=225164 RepID=V4A9Z8_LOTGI|nr:hypothetical protein LOTGIDRAFT_163226 [Lottia gigantea]ESO91865.1 hypothetical protein LOTGIDRAFT_163226 [Lottia gigantea]
MVLYELIVVLDQITLQAMNQLQMLISDAISKLKMELFPSLFSEMVLETIKHSGEFETMLKTVLYPKDFDLVSGWIPDVGDGSVLKEPVTNLSNDADLARVRVVARNTIERVARAANHGFEKRVLQYNNVVENNRWGNHINWKLYPLFGLLEHRKVSIGLPYKFIYKEKSTTIRYSLERMVQMQN